MYHLLCVDNRQQQPEEEAAAVLLVLLVVVVALRIIGGVAVAGRLVHPLENKIVVVLGVVQEAVHLVTGIVVVPDAVLAAAAAGGELFGRQELFSNARSKFTFILYMCKSCRLLLRTMQCLARKPTNLCSNRCLPTSHLVHKQGCVQKALAAARP